jgi:hypothetical protein
VEIGERMADGQCLWPPFHEPSWDAYTCGDQPKELLAAHAATYGSATDAAIRALDSGIATPAMIRHIFGNPFCSPHIDPAWLAWNGGTVAALCQAIYDGNTFDYLPILADALEDSGCTNPDILDHCRSPVFHSRGCWVVDLLLGRR